MIEFVAAGDGRPARQQTQYDDARGRASLDGAHNPKEGELDTVNAEFLSERLQQPGQRGRKRREFLGALSAFSLFQPATKVGGRVKRVMSAAARAKISKANKARWAKFRAEKSKKGKS